jgi:hypothetical protein
MPSLFLFSTSHANKTYRFFLLEKKKTKASLMGIAFAWSNNTRNKGQSNRKKKFFFSNYCPFLQIFSGICLHQKKFFSCKHTIRKLFPIWVQKKSFDFISGKQKSLNPSQSSFFCFFLACFFFLCLTLFEKKGNPKKKKPSKN